jgi:hypothetical protein
MISVTNVHEALARHEKALKLADLLDALHMTSAIASECSCLDWIRFAMLVEVNKPRQATQALVIEMLRGREAVRLRVAMGMINLAAVPQPTAA